MDGVLVDSEPHHRAAWRRLCLEEGVTLAEADVGERTLGRRGRESLPALLGRPVGSVEIARLMRRKAALYVEVSRGAVAAVPGAVRFVRALGEAGILRALATSALPEPVDPILAILGLADAFPVQVTGRDVRLGKPDPEVYATVAGRLQVAPSACVAFEDALVGVVAARRAGMSVVGVATSCSEAALREAGARMVVANFTEVTWCQVTSVR